MKQYFQEALEDHEIGDMETKAFLEFISSYEEDFCIHEGDSGLQTFEQVKQNKLYKKITEELVAELKKLMDE